MKKNRIFFAILAVALVTAVAIVSCKKEKQDQMLNNDEQVVQSADNMDEYLIAFKKKLLSAEKGGETISLEQAERDLGNLLNFDFGDANYETNVFILDTLRTNLTLTNGQVDLSQLLFAYNSLVDQIITSYNALELSEKSVYAIICNFDDSNKNEAIDVETVLVTRGYSETSEGIDDWRAGNKAGRCDGYLQGIWGAPEMVAHMLNQHAQSHIPGCPYGGRLYWTDVASSWIDPYHSDNMEIENSPRGYRLFLQYDGSFNSAFILFNTCLPHDEIMFYYNQCQYLVAQFKESFFHPIPNDHVITRYYINFWLSDGQKTAWWRLSVDHAKPNCTESSPEI